MSRTRGRRRSAAGCHTTRQGGAQQHRADGAHSRVRHELGVDFQGHSYPEDALLADVRLSWGRRDDEVHVFCRSDGRLLVCLPLPGHSWRVAIPFAGERGRRTPTLEEIQQLVDERAPERVVVSDPVWLASFRTHRRSADTYRRGRVLLAGDALHIHSPAGGQGMNTGIMDAHNLAWKLALVASGRSGDWLLDSYGEERRPVAEQVLALTHAIGRVTAMSHPVQRVVRDAVLPAALRLPAVSRRVARRMGQVHVAYPGSRLARPDGGSGGPRPGDRAPDVPVSGAAGWTRLYELLRQRRHVMVVSGSDPAAISESAALAPYRDVLAVVRGDFDGRRRRPQPGAVAVHLVRPDGYVAARGGLDEASLVLDYLRQLFGTATRAASAQPAETAPAIATSLPFPAPV